MNFSSMEYFTVLAQERNFTRASERLHITQQSLSAHIAGLEKELGCQLIVRHVPLELTYAGEVLLRYAADFQRVGSDMRREFCDIAHNQTGVLRVGAAPTRGQLILPETIAAFQREFPNIRVELTEGSNDALHQALLKGSVDLAIADFPGTLPGVRLRELCREEIVLLMQKDFFAATFGTEAETRERQLRRGDFSALRDCPLVLGGAEDIDGRIARAVLKRGGVARPVIRATSHNVGTLLRLCLCGAGACFCPNNILRGTLTPQQADGLLLFELGEDAAYAIRFGYPEQSYQWSVIERFMDCAAAVIGRQA